MAFKTFELTDIGTVTVYKRRGARHIRLSVDAAGHIKVSIPSWTPYAAGLTFARSKQAWLSQQLAQQPRLQLAPGSQIGKHHRLLFRQQADATLRSRLLTDGTVLVTHDMTTAWDSDSVQRVAHRAAVRALRQEAEALLPPRLRQLAAQHGFDYKSVSIKQLKSRWGSCDQDRNITLNLFLMQLPWHLIDYVLLHELTHTEVMQHGPTFWQAMDRLSPHITDYRRELRAHRAILRG